MDNPIQKEAPKSALEKNLRLCQRVDVGSKIRQSLREEANLFVSYTAPMLLHRARVARDTVRVNLFSSGSDVFE